MNKIGLDSGSAVSRTLPESGVEGAALPQSGLSEQEFPLVEKNAFRRLSRRGAAALSSGIEAAVLSPATTRALAEPFLYFLRRDGHTSIDLRKANNVLVVRLDEIGDVVLMTPFLRELRRNLHSGARVTLVVKPGTKNLMEMCPYADRVLTFDWNTDMDSPLATARLHGRVLRFAKRNLWKNQFDIAIVPRWDADYYHATFLAYFSGAVARVGYSEKVNLTKQVANRGADSLLTHPLYNNEPKHEVQYNLDVILAMGGEINSSALELWLTAEDETFADRLIARNPGARFVAFGVGAGASKRRWSVRRFVEVGRRLIQQVPTRIVVVGGPADTAIAKVLENELGGVINITGKTMLRETVAVLKKCDLFIGNDAGPMHIAAAVGVPVIELSCQHRNGPMLNANSPARFRPWGGRTVVLQPDAPIDSCKDTCEANIPHCILGITVDDVLSACVSLQR